MKPEDHARGYLIFCGVISAFAGASLGRIVRHVGEQSAAYDGRWGGIVGVVSALVLLTWLTSDE